MNVQELIDHLRTLPRKAMVVAFDELQEEHIEVIAAVFEPGAPAGMLTAEETGVVRLLTEIED